MSGIFSVTICQTFSFSSREGSRRGVEANIMNYDIRLSELELQFRYVYFRTFGKGIKTFFLYLWVKRFHYCSSTSVTLGLNNP